MLMFSLGGKILRVLQEFRLVEIYSISTMSGAAATATKPYNK